MFNSNITLIEPPSRIAHRFVFDTLDRVVMMLAPDLISHPDSLNSFNESMIYKEGNDLTKESYEREFVGLGLRPDQVRGATATKLLRL